MRRWLAGIYEQPVVLRVQGKPVGGMPFELKS